MKEAFFNDPMMKEIHEIREKHFQETKSLPFKERNQLEESAMESFLSSHGYKLVPTSRGTHKIVRIS